MNLSVGDVVEDESLATYDRSPHRDLRHFHLPPPGVRRWGFRKKEAVVQALRAKALTEKQACDRYELSSEELASWMRMVDKHGSLALRTTQLMRYRRAAPVGAD